MTLTFVPAFTKFPIVFTSKVRSPNSALPMGRRSETAIPLSFKYKPGLRSSLNFDLLVVFKENFFQTPALKLKYVTTPPTTMASTSTNGA